MADKIRLIASDLDGTLLLHGARACSSELFSLVRQLSDRGIYFVPASGRQYPNMQRLFAPVDDKLMYLRTRLHLSFAMRSMQCRSARC